MEKLLFQFHSTTNSHVLATNRPPSARAKRRPLLIASSIDCPTTSLCLIYSGVNHRWQCPDTWLSVHCFRVQLDIDERACRKHSLWLLPARRQCVTYSFGVWTPLNHRWCVFIVCGLSISSETVFFPSDSFSHALQFVQSTRISYTLVHV